MLPRREKSGFTLIEVLTVIAIIAILAAILFPVFASARERARQGSCISNLHAIAQATVLYRRDHRAYPQSIMALRPDYLQDAAALFCPNDPMSKLQAAQQTDISYGYFWNCYGYTPAGDPKTEADVPWPPPARYKALGGPAVMFPTQNYSRAFRNAPEHTIITRCPWHRSVEADTVDFPMMWRQAGFSSSADNDQARAFDIVVFVDGTAKKLVLSSYNWEDQPE